MHAEKDARAEHWRVTRELEPRLLSHFLAVAETGSISAAAERLNLSQPALSKSIKQLEERLEVQLLKRLPTGTVLTHYGEALSRRGRSIQREVDHAVTELHSMKGGTKGVLRIGAGPAWSAIYLPPILAKFLEARPGISIEMQNGVIDTLLPKLNDGSLDIICTTLDFPNSSEIVKEPLLRVEHGLFARAGHSLLEIENLTPKSLEDWSWATLKGDYVGHNRLGAYFAANRMAPPTVRIEMVPDLSIVSMVAQSNLLCSLPLEMEKFAKARGVELLPLDAAELWSSKAGVAYRKTDYPPPASEALLGMIRDQFDAPLPLDGS